MKLYFTSTLHSLTLGSLSPWVYVNKG